MTWDALEAEEVRKFLASRTALRSAIAKFCEGMRDKQEKACAAAMATVPRRTEEASDCAAHADAYGKFFRLLEIEAARDSSGGPTA